MAASRYTFATNVPVLSTARAAAACSKQCNTSSGLSPRPSASCRSLSPSIRYGYVFSIRCGYCVETLTWQGPQWVDERKGTSLIGGRRAADEVKSDFQLDADAAHGSPPDGTCINGAECPRFDRIQRCAPPPRYGRGRSLLSTEVSFLELPGGDCQWIVVAPFIPDIPFEV